MKIIGVQKDCKSGENDLEQLSQKQLGRNTNVKTYTTYTFGYEG